MKSDREKLSLLSEMITFAQADNRVKDSEYNFLLAVARQLGVNKQVFDSLFTVKVDAIPLKSESQRILQFHRLVLLMNVDQEQHLEEMIKLREFGLKMGLSPAAIQTVLEIMHQYPNKVIPPKVLIDIFKAQHN
jgi:uncharacterized tellurite resistance protein B-like protein